MTSPDEFNGAAFYALYAVAGGAILLLVLPGVVWMASSFGALTLTRWALRLVKALFLLGAALIALLLVIVLAVAHK